MKLGRSIIIAALIASSSAPALAESAAPLSVANRVGAATSQANDLRGNSYFLPALVLIAVLAAAILLSKKQRDDGDLGNPVSP